MNEKIKLTNKQKQVIFGGLLGDAHLTKQKYGNSQLAYVSSIKSHVGCFQSFFKNFEVRECKNGPKEYKYFDKRTKKTYTRYVFRTRLNIVFTELKSQWYNENGIKIIPHNLKITPTVCLWWYLGDGGLNHNYSKKETQYIKLSTNCFKENDIKEILIPQLSKFEAFLSKTEKGQPIVLIPRRKIDIFLKYIGKCPFKEYEYKWNVFPYKNKNIEKNGMKNHSHLEKKCIKEYKKGKTAYFIAKEAGVEINVVKYYLKKEGIFIEKRDVRTILWILKDPNGNLYETNNLIKFAEVNKLNHSCLRRVAKGQFNAHKGWKCNYKN